MKILATGNEPIEDEILDSGLTLEEEGKLMGESIRKFAEKEEKKTTTEPLPKTKDNSLSIFLVVMIVLVLAIIAYLNNKNDGNK